MVAEASSTTPTPNSKVLSPAPANTNRSPLLPDNNGRSVQRRPKPKDVTARYLSYTASSKVVTDAKSSTNSIYTPRKIFPAPLAPVTSAYPMSNRRDQSVERRRTTKTSARSLSVSFQGESFALPVSKVEKLENNVPRSGTPERKKAPATPARVSEYWRSRQGSFMTVSADFTTAKMKLTGSETASAVRAKLDHNNLETVCDCDNSDYPVSDTDSISSGSTLGHVRGVPPRAIVVPARFWQETINLLRRVQPVPVSVSQSPPLLKNNKQISISGCKVLNEGPKPAPVGSSFSPSPVSTASILSFCGDSKRGKVGEKKLVDAHVLRVLHNKHMQWRFANAKADAAMVVQRAAAQKTLYNAWVTISKLWYSLISKRLQIQQLKHNLKLHSLLKKQMLYLDNWDLSERDHSISLSGAIVALESSSLCLPVICGAKADIQNLKGAICSAVDVMEAMAVSLYSLVTKVENVNSMAFELSNAMKTECSLLDQFHDQLSALTLLETQDCSLRTHALQLIPPATTTKISKMTPF